MISRLREWLRQGLWQEDLRRATRGRALGIGAARVSVYAFQSFRQNLVGIQAAGLTTITLLALVPLLWLGFGVIKGLGFAEAFRQGIGGVRHDAGLYASPWGFCLQDITAEVHLWHGEEDGNVPVSVGRYVAEALPNCHARFIENEGHLSVPYKYVREYLSVLVASVMSVPQSK